MTIDDYTVSYAQNREDIIIEAFFENRKKGFYIDVGAANPNIDSVTKLFYEKGWRGINIEPIGHIFKVLKEARKRDKNLNIGLSNKAGTLKFREYASDGFSTFSSDMHQQYEEQSDNLTKKYIDYEVQVRTLKDVLSELNVKNIQFLKVDVEGYEYEVLSGNDWSLFRPELVCVEANHVKHDWRPLLLKNSYKKVYFDGLNEYYVSDESDLIKEFPYVEAIINREPIVNHELIDIFTELEHLRGHAQNQSHHIKYIEETLKNAEDHLAEIDSIKKHFKHTIKHKIKRLLKGASR